MSDEGTPPEGGQDGKADKGFTPPASQDELNRIIEARLARERGKFADYDDLREKATKFDEAQQASLSEIERERQAREAAEKELNKYRTREQVSQWAAEIVKDSAIPASVLRGSTKEELAEHFEQLKALAPPASKSRTHVPPGKPVDGESTGSRAAAALRQLRTGQA